jgi:hypothetical protein
VRELSKAIFLLREDVIYALLLACAYSFPLSQTLHCFLLLKKHSHKLLVLAYILSQNLKGGAISSRPYCHLPSF